ncbi:hypothetical protein DVU_0108 [Nitratidesulfovibrio vulgaris str. Hildenborough]|uniref:Uncharacterized protein n=1 Tax=Nitratidesulfovibrio vulgaris (strain ATCC 29579 / DSM 644 / CCUG 34227 / NCIMB 8303 / VKM B-1760 / Hildenborough) TaxID=882 RepID=Q72FV5_NITV2|nr:hypothetical protein DVU_0108 [Nitratidesulfovibrio vulgaris str. Hildenborough]
MRWRLAHAYRTREPAADSQKHNQIIRIWNAPLFPA